MSDKAGGGIVDLVNRHYRRRDGYRSARGHVVLADALAGAPFPNLVRENGRRRARLNDDDFDYDDDDRDFGPDSYEDERRAARGTAMCDGLCDPQCSWCLVGHVCPDECAPGPCPYASIAARSGASR